jgi:hypothetical protein
MRRDKLLNLADKQAWAISFEYDSVMGPDNKVIREQYKVWSFTESQLKAFVKDIEKAVLSKYEIIE